MFSSFHGKCFADCSFCVFRRLASSDSSVRHRLCSAIMKSSQTTYRCRYTYCLAAVYCKHNCVKPYKMECRNSAVEYVHVTNAALGIVITSFALTIGMSWSMTPCAFDYRYCTNIMEGPLASVFRENSFLSTKFHDVTTLNLSLVTG
jgi:hypothetical protein